ncbi:hypothetical protein K7J14_01720 [Treponema zuelzerae]|uniref:Uncharacterized protein n=1 Tax=Teretinema zuelzerae TaxID=156 RepID=A0AAE3EFJ5_9SPIR|nr:hypothetical protein [Teretinema zuelzerae]MCD1653416.1 hypothetical protein [Teretinema zuelzerae]
MKKFGTILAVTAIVASLFISCSQDGDSGSSSSTTLSPNQVSVVVTGLVKDFKGDLITSASVGFSDGDTASVAVGSRALKSSSVNSSGQFELEVINSAFDNGKMTIVVKKDGYLPYVRQITIPTFAAVTNDTYTIILNGNAYVYPINVTSKVKEVSVDTDSDDTDPVVYVSYDTTVGGFECGYDMGAITMYPLNGRAQGRILVVRDLDDGTAGAVPPPEGSKVAFRFKNGTFTTGLTETIVYALTDATGNFTFSDSVVAPNTSANPLPVFFADTDDADTTYATVSIQSATSGGASDASGMAYLVISKNFNNLEYLQVGPTLVANSYNNFGTIYAEIDNRARVTGWTPQTTVDGSVVPMNPLTATSTPAPITLTFSKALDATTVSTYGVSFTATNWSTRAASVTLAADGLSAEIVPVASFPKGATVNLDITDWAATDGSALINPDIDFVVQGGIRLTDCSWLDDSMTPAYVPYTTTSYSVTFDQVPVRYNASLTSLYNVTDGASVPATIALDATARTLTATPTVALEAGNVYEIRYSVSSGITGDPDAAYSGTAPDGFNVAQMRFTYAPDYMLYLTNSNLWATGSTYTTVVSNAEFAITGNPSITFNRAVQTSPAPVFELRYGAGPTIVPVTATTTDNLTFTFDPVTDLIEGTVYTLAYTVYGSADGIISVTDTVAFTTASTPKLVLTASSLYLAGVPTTTLDPATTSFTLTFDRAVNQSATGDFAADYTLTQGANEIDLAVAYNAAGTVVTLTPGAALKAGTAYSLAYTVFHATGFSVGNSTTGTIAFTTAKNAALAAPTLALDTLHKTVTDGRSAYDNGEGAFYLTVAKNADADAFAFQYKLDDDNFWQDIAAVNAVMSGENATVAYYTVTPGVLIVSGETIQIRAKATAADRFDSLWSTALSFVDGVAPLNGDVLLNAAAVPADGIVDIAIGANAGNPLAARYTYTVTIGGENMLASLSGTPSAGGSASLVQTADNEYTLYVIVGANVTADITGTLSITLTDAAGNIVDMDPLTAGNQALRLNL